MLVCLYIYSSNLCVNTSTKTWGIWMHRGLVLGWVSPLLRCRKGSAYTSPGFHEDTSRLDTVDGSEMRLTSWFGTYPVIYRGWYIPMWSRISSINSMFFKTITNSVLIDSVDWCDMLFISAVQMLMNFIGQIICNKLNWNSWNVMELRI